MKKVLFVCSYAQSRSPTAEIWLSQYEGFEVKSAGTYSPEARVRLSEQLIEWADMIFVMEEEHKEVVLELCPDAESKITVLNIPDRFAVEELMDILEKKLGYLKNGHARRNMSEKVLGIIKGLRRIGWRSAVNEALFVTSDRVVVARLPDVSSGYLPGGTYNDVGDIVGEFVWTAILGYARSKDEEKLRKAEEHLKTVEVEDILKADNHSFAIPNSEITKIELKYGSRLSGKLGVNIMTSKKKYEWLLFPVALFIPKNVRIHAKKEFSAERERCAEHCKNVLRPIFGDKLSVKK